VTHAPTVAEALGMGWRALRRHPLPALVLLAAVVSQGILQGLLVWALREVLRALEGSAGHSIQVLAGGALAVLTLWVLRALSAAGSEVMSARLAHRVEIDSMQGVLAKLLVLPVRFFERNSEGDLAMSAYNDLKGIRTVTLDLAVIVLSLSRLTGLAVVAWMLSPTLALIGLVAAPLGALPAYWLGRRITEAARFERDATVTLFDSFLQVSSGIRVIKVNRAEGRILERARSVGDHLLGQVVRQAQSRSVARLLLESVSGLGLIAVLLVGGRDVALGQLDWQSLLSLLVAMMAVYAPIVSLMGVYTSIRSVIPNLERSGSILGLPVDLADVPHPRRLRQPPEEIVLDGLSFAYDDRCVLEGVSATFRRGETIGIVGPSGAGKSTLVALMLRLYAPTAGRVLYDGIDLRELCHADLLDQCALVPQEPFVFVDTIANNIRFARPGAGMAEVMQAARDANVHDEIMMMESGYETMMGRHRLARGVSTGQKQRICIAAALLKNSPILFLDEATSNLDSVSERSVQTAVERLMQGRTSFVIAHRLSTLRAADRILVLDGGRLAGLDSHDALLRDCPTYEQLWRSQVGAAGTAPAVRAAAGV
jgi:subfamily B ATP-binding cassette protein MsbA